MKKVVFLGLFCLMLSTLHSRPVYLAATQDCQLIDHLSEINPGWQNLEINQPAFYENLSFASDESRIQTHLQLLVKVLKDKDVSHLAERQQQKRAALLNVLQAYAKAGQFPQNTHHKGRQPYFIDDYGTACAVGYLALKDGQQKLVQKIQLENNFAYIREMPYPELQSWGQENGFTTEELAWIQPAYQPQDRPFDQVGEGLGVEGDILVMATDYDEDMLMMAGQFSAVDGIAANNVIGWDGNQWHTFGEGVIGTVHAIAFHQGQPIIGGDFHLSGQPNAQNIARWNGENWEALQQGDMEGAIYALEAHGNTMYVGGDFQKVNEQPMAAFAEVVLTDLEWRNYAAYYGDNGFVEVPHGMAVNGTVTELEIVGNNLLVGGNFSLTAPTVTDENINQLECNHLAYWPIWGERNWLSGLFGPHGPVQSLAYLDGNIYVGMSDFEDGEGIAYLQAGLWVNQGMFGQLLPGMDSTVHGFIETPYGIMGYGGFHFSPFVGTFSSGTVLFSEFGYGDGFAIFDGSVHSVVEFQDALYFAGDYSNINNNSMNQLSKLSLITAQTAPELDEAVNVYQQYEQLIVETKTLNEPAQLQLFDMAGRQITSKTLGAGIQQHRVDVSQLTSGLYIYQIAVNGQVWSGKVYYQHQ